MRRDIFQAIADPTRRSIIVLIALQALTPNAIAEHFDSRYTLEQIREAHAYVEKFHKKGNVVINILEHQ